MSVCQNIQLHVRLYSRSTTYRSAVKSRYPVILFFLISTEFQGLKTSLKKMFELFSFDVLNRQSQYRESGIYFPDGYSLSQIACSFMRLIDTYAYYLKRLSMAVLKE